MPIEVPNWIRPITDDEFYELDYRVMAEAFKVHNELGRFCDEQIYQADLAARLCQSGFPRLHRELPIEVSYRQFRKCYYVDLIVGPDSIYELKAVAALLREHQKQTLNYLFLMGLPHGKLINFRGPSLEHEFVSTRITPVQRRSLSFEDSRWRAVDEDSLRLRQLLTELLDDWGGLLELRLYREALVCLLGGPDQVVKTVELSRHNLKLGRQSMDLLNDRVAFKLTAYGDHLSAVESHLRRLLSLAGLRAMHWINLHRFEVRLVTLFPRPIGQCRQNDWTDKMIPGSR